MPTLEHDVLLQRKNEDGNTEIHYPATRLGNIDGLENEFAKKANVSELNTHINNPDVHVNPATLGNIDAAISGLIEHTENGGIHTTAAEKAEFTKAAQDAAAALVAASQAAINTGDIESRLARLEDGVFNNITANPFLVTFASLTGITMTKGIWNKEAQRIEC